jgi:hypothetical protein
MARLSHPNVVQVYEVGKEADSGRHFIVMEFVEGSSLHDFQKRHPLRSADVLDQRLRLYLQAAAGLLAAHRAGLVHRDFKPDNVLLGQDGRVRVVDFGLARALDGSPAPGGDDAGDEDGSGSSDRRLTRLGTIMGTPGYMAPEQVRGEEADARSDQFSFCAALFESLYGEPPFGGETFEEFADNILAGRIRTPKRSDAMEVPIVVEQALRRGLSREPSARFPSMQELVTALEAGLLPDADSERSRRRKRRYLFIFAAGVPIIVAIRLLTTQARSEPGRGFDPRQEGLRTAWILSWGIGLVLGFVALALSRAIAKQPALRRQMAFFGVMFGFIFLGRTYGLLNGMTAEKYGAIELIGIGALCASHAVVTGARYLILTLVCVVAIVTQLIFPYERILIYNAAYALLAFFGVYLYRDGKARPGDAAS